MNMKRCILASVALAVLVAASLEAKVVDHGKHKVPTGLTNSPISGFTTRKVVTRSSVECSSTASAKAKQISKSAIIVAVASAFDTACGKYDAGYIKRMEVAFTKWARVFAKVVTSATAQCTTSGNAYGCAFGTSYAKAVSRATVAAFASAVAKASAGCKCAPGVKATALTKAFGSAVTFQKLTATAFSKVTATACAKNGQSASASIYQTCLASASAKVFAKALAEALAASSCYSADALTKIRAVTGSTTYITEGCKRRFSESGNGQTGTGSSGGATVDVQEFLKKVGKV